MLILRLVFTGCGEKFVADDTDDPVLFHQDFSFK